jgi:ubiquinone/menaquinone biosynthesis C-methylase UbiE
MRVRGRRVVKRAAIAADRVVGPALRRLGVNTKELYEYAYWRSRQIEEKELVNSFYERLFTRSVGLTYESYRGKRILDVGCGPRGSLEWATHAAERVGIDVLAERYRRFGTDRHAMRYVEAGAEDMPFDDGYFDVVTSFNSLDHVVDVRRSLREMARVLAPGGTMVLVVDIHRRPTVAEPQVLPWGLATWLDPALEVVEERHLEKRSGRLAEQMQFDHEDPADRYGVLLLKAVKRP